MKRLHAVTFFIGFFSLSLLAVERPWNSQEKWAATIASFEAADQKNPPQDHPILFVGSSSIRMWELDTSWPDLNAINRGFGGSTIYDSITFFDRIIEPYEPKAIVVYAGDNDVAKGLSVDEVVADYLTLSGMVDARLPNTPLIYIAIKPSLKRWEMWPDMKAVNDRIAAICAEDPNDTLYFADIAAPMLDTADGAPNPGLFLKDGLHLNPEGYKVWKGVVDPLLIQAGAKK